MTGMKMSMRTRAVALIALFMLVTNLLLGTVLIRQTRSATKTQINERMLDIVNTAASMLDGDVLDRLSAADEGTPEYEAVRDTLIRFRDNINLDYIYYVRDMGDGTFTFGIDTDPVAPASFGDPVVYTDALYTASRGEAAVDEKPYEDAWGRFYSAFSPVFDSEGKVAGVVTADFNARWYEEQLNRNQRTILFGSILFTAVSIGLMYILSREFYREMRAIREDLGALASDLDSLTKEFTGDTGVQVETKAPPDDIRMLGRQIAELRGRLHDYISNTTTRANSMITAMSADYSSVYYANLDTDECICYRADHSVKRPFSEGDHFSYRELFERYANNSVTDAYREGFLRFIEPDNVREALASQPIIAYRYLAHRNGKDFYEMIRMAGVRRAEDRDDHMVHAVGVGLTKIDEEMRDTLAKNQALAEALTVAEEASVAKTAFLSSMSHEIRTPMNAIIGLNTLALHDETLSDKTREYLEKTGASARHLLDLINDILDMSRIESGRIVLRREEFSFSAVLEQINTMVMSQCSDKGLHYECRLLSPVDDFYIGDDMKLKEVLINILSNAIKFTDPPGSVTFTVERTAQFEDQATLRFRVKDTGIGMDKDYIPKIFDPFSQEDSSRKNKYGSTGLGMAITKNIVEMMNGSISVTSEKGVGSEFAVVVTLRCCDHAAIDREDSVDPKALRVLVVDDEEIAGEHARMVLGEAGIRADVCRSGTEALKMLEVRHIKQEPYNLVLMDWKMPEMDGLEAARQIRARYSNETTVIILTAYNWDEILNEAVDAGVDSFLAKPLFASNVIAEFERIARRNNMSLFREKKRADLTGRRILLAEDTEVNADIMMDILSIADVETDHAEDGQYAVEMFRDSPVGTYSAILMDIRMPRMDGLEAAEAIRAMDRPDARTIPIIALTANAFDEDVQRSLQAGMNAHLTKPVDSDHLYQALEELIYEAEAGKQNS